MEHQRKKSCRQCRQSKTRCDLSTPHCQRCEKKKLACKYENQQQRQNTPSRSDESFHSWVAGTKSPLSTPRTGQGRSPQPQVDAGFDSARISGLLDFDIPLDANLDDEYSNVMQWNPERATPITERGSRTVPWEREAQDDVCWYEFPSANNRNSTPGLPFPITAKQIPLHINDFALSMLRSSKSLVPGWPELTAETDKIPNLLSRRPAKKAGELLTKNFIWATLKTQAFDFEHGTLPFFVHRSSSPEDGKADTFSEALANCKSIIAMYRQKTPACNNLVVKTLLLEIQRIYEQSGACDEITLLHGLQALVTYTIIIAADEKRCSSVSVIARLTSGETAAKIHHIGWLTKAEARGNFPSWKDWIQAESKRRTLIVMHLIDVLLDLSLNGPRPDDCVVMEVLPLPCSKALWEAETEEAWEEDYKKYLSNRRSHRLITVAALRESHTLDIETVDADLKEDLTSWADGVDGLGALILNLVMCR